MESANYCTGNIFSVVVNIKEKLTLFNDLWNPKIIGELNGQQIKLAKRLQAIAQTGLAFSKDVFDRERYEQVQQISAELISPHTPFSTSEVVDIFAGEGGYTTPKIGVRAAIVRKNDENGSAELLLVQELADNNLWTRKSFCFCRPSRINSRVALDGAAYGEMGG